MIISTPKIVTIDNPFELFLKQKEVLAEIAKIYGFKQSIPVVNSNQRSFNSKFNNWKIQLNEFTKGQDQLSVGCIDVLSGKGDYPEISLTQKKKPLFKCQFSHELFV